MTKRELSDRVEQVEKMFFNLTEYLGVEFRYEYLDIDGVYKKASGFVKKGGSLFDIKPKEKQVEYVSQGGLDKKLHKMQKGLEQSFKARIENLKSLLPQPKVKNTKKK